MNLLQKATTLWSGWLSQVGRQDGNNLVTNRVTLQEYEDAGGPATASSVLGLSAAWACVNLLAGTIASLPLMVYRTDRSGRRTVASDHRLYSVLHDSPNADQTAMDFWEFICASIELQGDGFSEIERNAVGDVTALDVPVPPEIVTRRRLSSGALEYEWTANGRRRVVPEDQVLHIRGFGGNPLGGLSTLAFGRQTFGIARAIDRSAASTFSNGVQASGAFISKRAQPLNAEQMQVAEKIITEKYVGANKAGRPLLLNSDMAWQALSINPNDAQMLESRAFSVEEVCRFFGVPPFMVGHTEKSTSWGTGIEQQTIGFVQFTLRRRLKRIEQALEKQLLTARDRTQGLRIEFNLEGLLRGDSKTRAEFYASGLQNGWRTINEVRELENLPPVAGGDVPRMQMQNVPITEAGSGLTGDDE